MENVDSGFLLLGLNLFSCPFSHWLVWGHWVFILSPQIDTQAFSVYYYWLLCLPRISHHPSPRRRWRFWHCFVFCWRFTYGHDSSTTFSKETSRILTWDLFINGFSLDGFSFTHFACRGWKWYHGWIDLFLQRCSIPSPTRVSWRWAIAMDFFCFLSFSVFCPFS